VTPHNADASTELMKNSINSQGEIGVNQPLPPFWPKALASQGQINGRVYD